MTGSLIYKRALINVAASADREAVAAVAGSRIQLHAVILYTDSTGGTLRWEDGAAGTALSGVMPIPASSEFTLPFSEVPWIVTTAGNSLSMEVGAGALDGHIIYSEAD